MSQDLKPSKDLALLRVTILNVERVNFPVLHIMGVNTGMQHTVSLDANGKGSILLPVNASYIMNHYETIGIDMIHIPAKSNLTMEYSTDFSKLPENPRSHAPLILYVRNSKGLHVTGEEIFLISKKTGEKFTGTSDVMGQLLIRLPFDDTFILEFTDAPNYMEIPIPANHLQVAQFEVEFEGSGTGLLQPNMEEALFNITYNDLDGKPVPEEEISITGQSTGISFVATTDNKGQAQVLVPIGDNYDINITCHHQFGYKEISAERGLYQTDFKINYLSSKEIKYRLRERELQIARRDSLFAAKNSVFIYEGLDEQERNDTLKEIWKTEALKDLTKIKEKIESNPLYFRNNENVVAAVLYRTLNQWKDKIIVMDLTCSMDTYAQQVLLWIALRLSEDENNQYLFFNDGDGMSDQLKKIGKVGGFHYTNAVSIDTIIDVMLETKWKGCGGGQAENDIEALQEGIKYYSGNEELVLIADNYSTISDIILVDNLKVPVHVILCGVTDEINEEYLTIAAKTEGSVHTIEEDISELSELNEGTTIMAGGHTYMYVRGRFLLKH